VATNPKLTRMEGVYCLWERLLKGTRSPR
jgi:hypothetical protein